MKTRKILAAALIALLGLTGQGCASTADSTEVAASKQIKTLGAYPSWRRAEMPPSKLPWDRLTHVGFCFALPKDDGGIDMRHAVGLDETVREARKHGVKVMLFIGGANGSAPFHAIAASAAKRARFVEETQTLIRRHQLDGIDIDWEHWSGGEPDPKGRLGLLTLIKELSAALRPAGKRLSVDVFGSDWYGKHYDAKLVDYVDWIHIMAYDGSGSWSEKPGPHSSYEMIEASLDYWIGKVGKENASKLVLNVPFYGKKFPSGFKKGQAVGGMDYADIVKADPANANRDRYVGPGYTVFYNGQETIKKKIGLAQKLGLFGVGIWELTQDSLLPGKSLIGQFPKQR